MQHSMAPPLPQVAGHAGAPHVPALHVWLPPHDVHCCPPLPQRCFVVLTSWMHCPLKQHPLQLPGPQVGGS
jgi:hypothetical protein